MISFRYHIVTVTAVFLALAVGVVLGSGPLRGSGDPLAKQAATDRQANADLEEQVAAQRSVNGFNDDFAAAVAPGLVGETLTGRVVTMVVLPTAKQADVKALSELVEVAGGSVGGTVVVGRQLVDVGGKQLVDELGSQFEGRARGVEIPEDANPYERIGALLARAVGARRSGGQPVDGPATSILAGMDTAKLASAPAPLSRRGDLVLIVAGPGEGDPDQRRGTGTIVASLAEALDKGTSGAVLVGPEAAAQAGGQLRAVREDGAVAREVSTVDSADRTAGQVVAMLALAGQAAGRSGQYGAVDAADGAVPGAGGD